ncbi:unnamed protein product [Malus baccata var. baccata]|uniref:Uncharacterized protein n=1 Tax=Malus domestica TaxID=3750 RepID=A0A498HSY4_MALDO|nr:hypothetical protein DVH24_013068 [Malus domestica]
MGGGHGEGITYKGITVHQPKRWHTLTGKGMVGDTPGRATRIIIRFPVEEPRVDIIKGLLGGILV